MPAPSSIENDWFHQHILPLEPVLRGWLRNRFPTIEDTDDLLQDTYSRVCQLHQQNPGGIRSIKPLLFATAHNLALDILRRRRVVRFEAMPETNASEPADPTADVVELVVRRQELQLLSAAIQALPQRCRQVVTLRKLYGMPLKEIAARLGISENTVETQVRLGVRRCTDYLSRYGLP